MGILVLKSEIVIFAYGLVAVRLPARSKAGGAATERGPSHGPPQGRAAGTDSQKTSNIQRRTSNWAEVDAELEVGCSMFTRRVGSARCAERTSQDTASRRRCGEDGG